jgi:Putative auto-transporter adhesin, head GIN domain
MSHPSKQPFHSVEVISTNTFNMRNLALIFLFSLLVLPTYAQQSEVRALGSFKGIKVSEAIDVYLKKGEKESAKVEVTGIEPSDVLTELSGNFLKVHMRDGRYSNRYTVKVYVTYVNLDRISSSSAANVFSEGTIKANAMEISASSAASVEISLEAESVTLDVSSAGDATLEGKSKSLIVEASSAGSVDAYNLDCENVNASVSSAGSLKVSVKDALDAQASSGGSIRYRGNPMKTITNASSGGSVKKSN